MIYTVRMKFESMEAAKAWFEDVYDAGLAAGGGLRHLELDDLVTPVGREASQEVPLIIANAGASGRRRAWVVEPE